MNNQRNSHGVKDSVNKYRNGGKFYQWAYAWPKTGDEQKTYSIETKEDKKAALEYFQNDDPSREYKAVKVNGFYEIFATDPR